jgi:hypothetical protein
MLKNLKHVIMFKGGIDSETIIPVKFSTQFQRKKVNFFVFLRISITFLFPLSLSSQLLIH